MTVVERATAELGRRTRTVSRPLVTSLAAVALGLAAGAALITIAGGDPIAAYRDMIVGSVGSPYAIGQMLTVSIPLVIIGLGLALAFRGRVYNIGAEGQLYLGALAGGAVAVLVPLHVGILIIPLSLLVGAAAGAAWGLLVGVLRSRWQVNEVISSLLLNYVAILIFSYVIRKPLRDTTSTTLSGRPTHAEAMLPQVGGLMVNSGVLIALALVPIAMYVFNRTPFGFQVRMLGLNPDAARAAGVQTNHLIVRLMVLSGATAGLAGAIQVLGVDHRLVTSISNNYGYTAIVVALLAGMRAGGVVPAALFIGAVTVGGSFMSTDLGLPYAIVSAIQGVFVVFLLLVTQLGRRT